MPLNTSASSGNSHDRVRFKVRDLLVTDLELLQSLVDSEKVPVETYVSGKQDKLIVIVAGFRCYAGWILYLLREALILRDELEWNLLAGNQVELEPTRSSE